LIWVAAHFNIIALGGREKIFKKREGFLISWLRGLLPNPELERYCAALASAVTGPQVLALQIAMDFPQRGKLPSVMAVVCADLYQSGK
jgi:hypothetical protein